MDCSSYAQNTNRRTDLMNELTVAGGRVGGMVREFGMDVYTLLYLKCVTTKALLDSTGTSCSMSWGSLDRRGAGGGRIHGCVWLSPSAVHLKLSQHCQLATLQYKIKEWTVQIQPRSGFRYQLEAILEAFHAGTYTCPACFPWTRYLLRTCDQD